ncbi:MAG: hypothetical protein ACK2T6_04945 [Anaerolineae bacterium]
MISTVDARKTVALALLALGLLAGAPAIAAAPRGQAEAHGMDEVAAAAGRSDPAATGRWECWSNVDRPNKCRHEIRDLALVTARDGWAVGDYGTILRWDGQTWSDFASPTHGTLLSVDLANSDVGWAVGGDGLFRWDGASWTRDPYFRPASPGYLSLSAVDAIAPDDAWVVGSCALLHWDGSSWANHNNCPFGQLSDIAMSGPDDGWAIGYARILRWDGANWADFAPPISSLSAIASVTATDAWVVGGFGQIARWDGTEWRAVESPTTEWFFDLEVQAADWGWASGRFGLMQWDGQRWALVDRPSTSNLVAIEALHEDYAWAAGERGVMLEWRGSHWSRHVGDEREIAYQVEALHALSADDVWAVGRHGSVLRWDGVGWWPVPSPTGATLRDVTALGTDGGWAVGDEGTALKWDGAAWRTTVTPTAATLRGVAAISSSSAWAVGDGGTVIRSAGDRWTLVDSSTHRNLHDVAIVSPTEGYAVGEDGTLLSWDGDRWYREQLCDEDLLAIELVPAPPADPGAQTVPADGASTSDVTAFIVGESGVAFRLASGAAERIDLPVAIDLAAVSVLAPDSAWAVGENTIHRWDGDAWEWQMMPWLADQSIVDFRAVAMTSEQSGIAAGSGHRAYHWDGQYWWTPRDDRRGLYDVVLSSADSGWAVGEEGVIKRWDGRYWLPVASASEAHLAAVDVVDQQLAWAVGAAGTTVRWDGEAWRTVPRVVTDSLTDLSLAGRDDGWAVGASGVMLRLHGDEWRDELRVAERRLEGVSLMSPTTGWAVGVHSAVLELTGDIWSEHPLLQYVDRIADVDAAPDQSAWAVAEDGEVLKWRLVPPSMWQVATITDGSLSAVHALSVTEAWAVGANGGAYRLVHNSYEAVPCDSQWSLYGVAMVSEGDSADGGVRAGGASPQHERQAVDGWAVGREGVIERYVPPRRVHLPTVRK